MARYSNLGVFDLIKKNRRDDFGFSLLELLVVLVIISLMTAMIVPRMGGTLNKMNLKTAAKKIGASLRYARSRAASEKENYVASFDFESNRLAILIDRKLSENPDLTGTKADEADVQGHGLTESEESIVKTIRPKIYDLPEGVRFEKALSVKGEEETELFEIFFYPGGNSSGGKIILMGEEERRFIVEVDFITGSVKLVE